VVVALLTSLAVGIGLGPASAEYAEIEGSGSTWAYTIVQQWIADVNAQGMRITFNNNGSSQGRKDFANYVTDFGDSDIPYQGVDPVTHQADASSRPYAYLPVVAGGTAFTYQIKVAGKLVTNLRLSGETIAKIFTNKITNWSDPQITKENGGHALPSLPITPVVRSDGSGATAQFTLWLDHQYPSIWRSYNGSAGLTSIYPRKGRQVAASGDDGVMNTVDSAAGNGDIGYAEYSYPLNARYPVVYVENKAGYFVQPTQYNVAVALTKARINMQKTINGKPNIDYLTQELDGVYNYGDPRTYPISSYSYMIIPTSASDQRMTVAKRQTVADFLSYSLCTGQSKAGPYGYSPLPLNLVKAAFGQLETLGPSALSADGSKVSPVAGVKVKNPSANLAACDNPTFVKGNLSANHLAQVAPMPLPCQKATAQPCGDAVVPPGTPGKKGAGSPTSTGTTATSGSTGTPGTTAVDPTTGQAIGATTDGTTTSASGPVSANTATVSNHLQGDNKIFGGVAVLELLAIVLLPGLYIAWTRRRKGTA